MTFSQRQGIEPIRTALQINSMDMPLRSSLWNVLHFHIWDTKNFLYTDIGSTGAIGPFSRILWFNHFKTPITGIPSHPTQILRAIEKHFFEVQWNKVYEFLEAVISIRNDKKLEQAINFVLERELAGYRLINQKFVNVTDPVEIKALEEALSDNAFKPVADHLARAIELLSDRNSPDYRNSVKESISAVESTVRILLNDE